MSDANTSIVMTSETKTAPPVSGQRTVPAYPQICRLLTLPAELRLHIYRLVLVQGPLGRPSTFSQHTLQPPLLDCQKYETKNIALLATCQQIHDEAIGIFYSYNTFIFPARVQDLAGCFQAQPIFSLMRYFNLQRFFWESGFRGGNEELTDVDACMRVIMGSCPTVKLVKVDVYHMFAEEAEQKWVFLDVSPDMVWYTFQAFPMRNTQQTSLVPMNFKRKARLFKDWDLKAYVRNYDAEQRLLYLEGL